MEAISLHIHLSSFPPSTAFTEYQSRGAGTQEPRRELNGFIPQHALTLAEVTMVPEPIPLALLVPQPKAFILCDEQLGLKSEA